MLFLVGEAAKLDAIGPSFGVCSVDVYSSEHSQFHVSSMLFLHVSFFCLGQGGFDISLTKSSVY